MSYLYRTGNGRNNIAFTTTANSSTKYLRRTSTGRNNITWTTIPQGSTYNILQRNGTGRNNILWANLNIYNPGLPASSTDITSGINSAESYPDLQVSLMPMLPKVSSPYRMLILSLCHILYGSTGYDLQKAEWPTYDYYGSRTPFINSSKSTSSNNPYFGYVADKDVDYDNDQARAYYNGFQQANKLSVTFSNGLWITFHLTKYKFYDPSYNGGAYSGTIGNYTWNYLEYKTNISFDFANATSLPTDQLNKLVGNVYNGHKVVFSTTW